MSEQRMGGLTVVARELTATRQKLVTRQGVYMWWSRRDRNDFPERHPVPTRTGNTRLLFDIDEVVAWYDTYMSTPWQGRKRTAEVFTPQPIGGTLEIEGKEGEEKNEPPGHRATTRLHRGTPGL